MLLLSPERSGSGEAIRAVAGDRAVRRHPVIFILFKVAILFVAVSADGPWKAGGKVGPSKHFIEIETSEFKTKVFKEKKDTVLVFYSDSCGPCSTIHPALERLAEEIKSHTKQFHYVRIDEYRETGGYMFENVLPGFENGGRIPRLYHIKAGADKGVMVPEPIVAMGFSDKGKDRKKFFYELYSFIRTRSSVRRKLPELTKGKEKVTNTWEDDNSWEKEL